MTPLDLCPTHSVNWCIVLGGVWHLLHPALFQGLQLPFGSGAAASAHVGVQPSGAGRERAGDWQSDWEFLQDPLAACL